MRRSIHSNAEAQQTIARLSSEQLERIRQADAPSPQTRIVLAKLRKVQHELADSKELAATTLTFAEQLQGIFEQAQACAAATAVQSEIDRRKIEQLSTKITHLNSQLSQNRRAAEASDVELLAKSAAMLSTREQLQLSNDNLQRAKSDIDAAVAQSAQLQQQLNRAVADGQAASAGFVTEREAGRQEVGDLNTMLAEIKIAAQAAAPEMATISARMLSVEQQLRDSKHIAHRATVAKDVAEAAAIAERLLRIRV